MSTILRALALTMRLRSVGSKRKGLQRCLLKGHLYPKGTQSHWLQEVHSLLILLIAPCPLPPCQNQTLAELRRLREHYLSMDVEAKDVIKHEVRSCFCEKPCILMFERFVLHCSAPIRCTFLIGPVLAALGTSADSQSGHRGPAAGVEGRAQSGIECPLPPQAASPSAGLPEVPMPPAVALLHPPPADADLDGFTVAMLWKPPVDGG